jgi:hypothetical protein
MILHIKIEEAESIVTLPGVIGNVEVITVHFINLGILSWDSTSYTKMSMPGFGPGGFDMKEMKEMMKH